MGSHRRSNPFIWAGGKKKQEGLNVNPTMMDKCCLPGQNGLGQRVNVAERRSGAFWGAE